MITCAVSIKEGRQEKEEEEEEETLLMLSAL